MKYTLLYLLLLFSMSGFSQENGEIVIFDNSGYKFHVILNGIKQNAKAESNVRIQGLNPSFYSCKVMAEDNTFALDKNIIVKSDTLITYRITNKKGKFKLRFYSEVPLRSAVNSGVQEVVSYHSEELLTNSASPAVPTTSTTSTVTTTEETVTYSQSGTPNTTGMDVNVSVSGTESGVHQSVETTTSTIETTEGVSTQTSAGSGDGSISISMDISESGANVSISGSGLEGEENMGINTQVSGDGTFTESTVTTTTTTTTTSSGDWSTTEVDDNTEFDVTANGSVDCFVGEDDFNRFVTQMKNEDFDDDKTTLAKHYVQTKCLSVSQIGMLMDILSFSEDRMTVAKAAYNLCYNSSEYYQLTEKFDFSDDKNALLRFIDGDK